MNYRSFQLDFDFISCFFFFHFVFTCACVCIDNPQLFFFVSLYNWKQEKKIRISMEDLLWNLLKYCQCLTDCFGIYVNNRIKNIVSLFFLFLSIRLRRKKCAIIARGGVRRWCLSLSFFHTVIINSSVSCRFHVIIQVNPCLTKDEHARIGMILNKRNIISSFLFLFLYNKLVR